MNYDMVPRPRNGLSLCAGAGGLDMGLMLAEPDFHTRCYVEWEDYPRQSIIAAQRAGYFAPAPIWDDVTTFDAKPLAGCIDTLLGGYPCQGESLAGKRRGKEDERWLWEDIERIIEELGPTLRWCFFENVRGHVSLGLQAVLRGLHRLGFKTSVGIFSAGETGAPHERQRVFIVAYRENTDRRSKQQEGPEGRGRAGSSRNGAGNVENSGHPQRGPIPAGGDICNGDHAGRPETDRGVGEPSESMGHPRASDAEKGGPNQSFGAGGIPLPAQAANWPTPAAAQGTKGAQASAEAAMEREERGKQLALADRALIFSHPDPATVQLGLPPSQWRPTSRRLLRSVTSHVALTSLRRWLRRGNWRKRRLNPLFVEWLMAWPKGHALCACSETEFIHWQQQMRGALSQLPTAYGPWIWEPPTEAKEDTQMSLF